MLLSWCKRFKATRQSENGGVGWSRPRDFFAFPREIFSPSLVRRRGGIAIPRLDENPGASWDLPAVELLPELYSEVRRLAAALTTAPPAPVIRARRRPHFG